MSELLDVIRAHIPRNRYDDEGAPVGTYCTCGEWTGDYFADGEAGPFDEHLAAMVGAWIDQKGPKAARSGAVSDPGAGDGRGQVEDNEQRREDQP